MKRAVLFGFCAAAFLSCSDATGPVATASATVTRVTLGAPGSVDATLDIEMTNETSMAIHLAPCGGLSLERQSDSGGWDQVWSLACAPLTTSTNTIIIPAGSSRTLTTRITAQGSGATWPSGGLDGVYRIRIHVFPPDDVIERLASVTNLISAMPVISNEFAFPRS